MNLTKVARKGESEKKKEHLTVMRMERYNHWSMMKQTTRERERERKRERGRGKWRASGRRGCIGGRSSHLLLFRIAARPQRCRL